MTRQPRTAPPCHRATRQAVHQHPQLTRLNGRDRGACIGIGKQDQQEFAFYGVCECVALTARSDYLQGLRLTL
ncbi:uncharacterized protein DMAD_11846 [Drosophila madeirensis]|uniref:Uncharacterized protein n=1 Tax=Drosophila madeirensis TaxID=30013 RepID=A0AAU9FEX2_DROMD